MLSNLTLRKRSQTQKKSTCCCQSITWSSKLDSTNLGWTSQDNGSHSLNYFWKSNLTFPLSSLIFSSATASSPRSLQPQWSCPSNILDPLLPQGLCPYHSRYLECCSLRYVFGEFLHLLQVLAAISLPRQRLPWAPYVILQPLPSTITTLNCTALGNF